MKSDLLRFNGAVVRDPSIRAWQVYAPRESKPGTATDAAEISMLIDRAYLDIKARVENG